MTNGTTNSGSLEKLDQVDRELLERLISRQHLVQELFDQAEGFDAGQENIRLEKLLETVTKSGKEIPDAVDSLRQTIRNIASATRERLNSQSVSFLGPQYSYSHLAAVKYFGDQASFAPVASIPAVFDAVHRGDAASGLVPIENSTDGRVVDTLGMFVRRHMKICGEVLLPIHHNLLASGSRQQIKEIHSKPQALSQCRGWLAANFPAAKLVEVGSTTAAAESAAEDVRVAAVASLPAGRAYGLNAINQNIEDSQDNVTRFAVLGRQKSAPTGNDKTSLLFQVAHRPGALAGAMQIFRERDLNLTWIESFPSPETRSEYLFFIEFAGHCDQPGVAAAIDQLQSIAHRMELLGSYPVATPVT